MNLPQAGGADVPMTDIIDIKPLEKNGFDTRYIYYALIAVLAIILVILVIYVLDRLIKKRKKRLNEDVVVLPPDKVAMNVLSELETQDGIEEKEYYFKLTAIVRTYIKGRFGLDAPEMTTEELIPAIPAIPLDKSLASGLKDLLRTTDPVKFAGITAGFEKMKEDMTFARNFVESTRIIPENQEKENAG
jgi:hypothetical protein